MSSNVQSVFIAKSRMSLNDAKKWITNNKFKSDNMTSTPKSYKFIQKGSKQFGKFRTKIIKPGIIFKFGINK